MSTKKVFDLYSKYYDLFYKDKAYEKESSYIMKLLSDNGIQSGELLEFGSGTGMHAKHFIENGFKVHGIERSQDMIDMAIDSDQFYLSKGDISKKIITNKEFDAVLALFHVLSYQVDNRDLFQVFENASKNIKKGGIFLFDFWYSPAVYNLKPEVKVKRIMHEGISLTRLAEPEIFVNMNRVDVKFTIFSETEKYANKSFSEIHPMRHFSIPELEIVADHFNFAVVSSEEFLTSKEPSNKTWGVCMVLKKI